MRHGGSRWGDDAGSEFVHAEPVALSRAEFQEKLSVLYEPVFGKDVLKFGSDEGDCSVEWAKAASIVVLTACEKVVLFPVRQLAEKHLFETEIEVGGQKKRVRYECEQNMGFKRRWKVLSSKEKRKGGMLTIL